MRQLRLIIAAFLVMFSFSSIAKADVIDFEGGLDPLFNYSGVDSLGSNSVADSGYNSVFNATNSDGLVFNPNATSPSDFLWAGVGTFDLASFVIAGAWGNQTLAIEGWNDGVRLFDAMLDVTSTALTFVANWSGIDQLRIVTDPNGYVDTVIGGSGQHWALDEMVINAKAEVTVPEPGTLALLGLGLVGMGLTRRRKKA